MADYRRQQALPVTNINWGPWQDVGMAARSAQSLNQSFEFIPLDKGMRSLDKILNVASAQNIAILSPQYLLFMLKMLPILHLNMHH